MLRAHSIDVVPQGTELGYEPLGQILVQLDFHR
jgi:hypothetical protein